MSVQSSCTCSVASAGAVAPPWTPAALRSAARAMADGGGVAASLLTTLADPDIGVDAVVDAVSGMPGIALRVLKVANSAFYGQSGQIDSIERAILVLGLDVVRAVASVACMDRGTAVASRQALVTPRELMRHSLATALAAKDLAQLLVPDQACEVFIAGLVHDLGYLLLQRLAPGRRDAPLLDLHAECAAQVFEEWKLPPRLINATRQHHSPLAEDAADRWPALVAAAERLACRAGAGLAIEADRCPAPTEKLGVDWPLPELDPDGDAVIEIARRLPDSLASVAASLDL